MTSLGTMTVASAEAAVARLVRGLPTGPTGFAILMERIAHEPDPAALRGYLTIVGAVDVIEKAQEEKGARS